MELFFNFFGFFRTQNVSPEEAEIRSIIKRDKKDVLIQLMEVCSLQGKIHGAGDPKLQYILKNLPQWIQNDFIPQEAFSEEVRDNEGNHIIHLLLQQLSVFTGAAAGTTYLNYIKAIQNSVQCIVEKNARILTAPNNKTGLQPFSMACQFGDTLLTAYKVLKQQEKFNHDDLITYFIKQIENDEIKAHGLILAESYKQVETVQLLLNFKIQSEREVIVAREHSPPEQEIVLTQKHSPLSLGQKLSVDNLKKGFLKRNSGGVGLH